MNHSITFTIGVRPDAELTEKQIEQAAEQVKDFLRYRLPDVSVQFSIAFDLDLP